MPTTPVRHISEPAIPAATMLATATGGVSMLSRPK